MAAGMAAARAPLETKSARHRVKAALTVAWAAATKDERSATRREKLVAEKEKPAAIATESILCIAAGCKEARYAARGSAVKLAMSPRQDAARRSTVNAAEEHVRALGPAAAMGARGKEEAASGVGASRRINCGSDPRASAAANPSPPAAHPRGCHAAAPSVDCSGVRDSEGTGVF